MVLSLNGISAWIEVDGRELAQYGVEQDHDCNHVACWVASQADKPFSVVFRDDALYREHALGSRLRFDGSRINGKLLPPSMGLTHAVNFATRTVVQKDQMLTATSSRPFKFSKLELTDEEAYLDQDAKYLGEIQVAIYRLVPLELCPVHPVVNATGHTKVHERAKKAVTHCVSYGEQVQTAPQHGRLAKELDNVPLATFLFRYRDTGLLQAHGVIPNPPPIQTKPTAARDGPRANPTISTDVKQEPADEHVGRVDTTRSQTSNKRSNANHESEPKPAKKRIKRENQTVFKIEVIDLT